MRIGCVVAAGRYRRRSRGGARIRADRGRRSATIFSRRPTMCSASTRPAGRAGTATPTTICSTTRSCCSAISPAARKARLLDRRPDPAAAPDGARRQAGGLARRAVRRPVPARHRGRLERGRVRRAQREFPQSRPPLRGAGAGHAGAVGRAACHLQGPLAHDRGCRHQPAAGLRARCRCGSAAITSAPCSASPNGATAGCRTPIRPDQSALDIFAQLRRMTEAAGRDPAQDRDRGLGLDGLRQRGRLGQGGAVLETGRRLASMPDDDLQPPPPPAHPRPHDDRPPGSPAPLPRRGIFRDL